MLSDPICTEPLLVEPLPFSLLITAKLPGLFPSLTVAERFEFAFVDTKPELVASPVVIEGSDVPLASCPPVELAVGVGVAEEDAGVGVGVEPDATCATGVLVGVGVLFAEDGVGVGVGVGFHGPGGAVGSGGGVGAEVGEGGFVGMGGAVGAGGGVGISKA